MAKDKGTPTNASWGGRFSGEPAAIVQAFTDSQHYDRQLYEQDIRASMAHAAMLGRQGIIAPDEAQEIIRGLQQIKDEIERGEFVWQTRLEDVHMNIESRLTEVIGEAGKKLHTGRSRNDQVGLDFRLYVSQACRQWQSLLTNLVSVLYERGVEQQATVLPGFTHLQPAQPISLAQHLLAYAGMFCRDSSRIEDALTRIEISPLGAAALAGSTFPLDPASVASEVGFPIVYANSMDAVSDRDFVLEALFIASVIMMHLSRLCEEIVLWSTPAFGFAKLPDAFATGSSIMPQKKNPDVAELVRGKTGRVYGDLFALFTIMKGLPLAYNRDLQEDKEQFFDASETVASSLSVMAAMLARLGFNTERMAQACAAGYLNATDLADYLAARGLPFREAHRITGQLVAYAERKGVPLEQLSLEELRGVCPLIDKDIFECLKYETCVRRRETPGGTGPISVANQLHALKGWLDERGAWARE